MKLFTRCLWVGLALLGALSAIARAEERVLPRVEARSANFLAVGIVHGDHMSIHLSRLTDNAPVRDAQLTVLLRGILHTTVAEPDGGYSFQALELSIPGTASVQFQVAHEDLKGTLVVGTGTSTPEEKNSARQLGWWVLNFAVCIGFLRLWSRRRKAARDREAAAEAATDAAHD